MKKNIFILFGVFLFLVSSVHAIEKAVVDVDGMREVVREGFEEDINNISVKAVDVFDNPGIQFDSAYMRIVESSSNSWWLNSGDCIIIGGKTVCLISTASNNAASVEVDGMREIVREGFEEEINGIVVKAIEVHDEEGIAFDRALLRIIEDLPEHAWLLNVGDAVIVGGKTVVLISTTGGTVGGSSPSFMKIASNKMVVDRSVVDKGINLNGILVGALIAIVAVAVYNFSLKGRKQRRSKRR